MKHSKMLGVCVIAALVAMAALSVTSASATKLCKVNNPTSCPDHYPVGTQVDTSLQINQTLTFETTGGTVLDTCLEWTTVGKTSNTAATGEKLKGTYSQISWGSCTKTTDTISNGSFQINNNTGTSNGTQSWEGVQFTINTIFGSCVFGPATSLAVGTVTGGNPATVSINTIIPRISGACPAEIRMTGVAAYTEPNPVYIAHN